MRVQYARPSNAVFRAITDSGMLYKCIDDTLCDLTVLCVDCYSITTTTVRFSLTEYLMLVPHLVVLYSSNCSLMVSWCSHTKRYSSSVEAEAWRQQLSQAPERVTVSLIPQSWFVIQYFTVRFQFLVTILAESVSEDWQSGWLFSHPWAFSDSGAWD